MPKEQVSDKTVSVLENRGFLEEIYLGSMSDARFQTYVPAKEDPNAAAIIARYRDLIKDYPPQKLEKLGTIPDELMEGLKEIGLFGLNVPLKFNGQGLTLSGYLSVLRAMASTDMALAITPTAHLSIGMKGILLFGDDEQKKKYLPLAASGEMIFAYALTEPGTGSDAQHIETTAKLSGDGKYYLLNGQKTYITNGNYAGGLTVFAQLDPENPGFMGAFIVETSWDGVNVGNEIPKMGLKISSTTPISLNDVKVPVENMLGNPGDGFKIAMTILNYGRLGLGSGSMGGMEQSVDDMFERATKRKQFGVPIREFELVQDMIIKGRVHAFAAEAMTAFTAGILQRDHIAIAAMESSHVKLYGTTRAWDTLYDALQTAGGAGYLATLPYEKRMRDFRVTTVFEGTTEIHSIYPALFLLRTLGKEIKGKSRLQQMVHLVRGGLKKPNIPVRVSDPVLQKAAGMARLCARDVRKMIHFGLLRHGKEMASREFLLKRITTLSIGAFSLIAAVVDINAVIEAGEDATVKINLLDYLVEEVNMARRLSTGIPARPIEIYHKRVFADLLAEKAGDGR